jgi:hypothetical protein
MIVRALAILLVFAAAGRLADAQSGPPQIATIGGIVVTAETSPQPVGGAVVTVSGGGLRGNLSAVTDERGRFLLTHLPPGRYNVLVSKPAYLTMAYGAARPGRIGASVAVAPGQSVDLQIALARGAVVTGLVRDHLGDPVAGVQVIIGRPSTSPQGGTFVEQFVSTDDRGVYRVFGLMPEEYVVTVLPTRFSGGETYAPSREDVDAKLRRLEQRAAQSPAAAARAPIVSDASVTLVPANVGGSGGSITVRLAAGEERRGIDFQLVSVRTVKVSGLIQSGDIPLQQIRPQLLPLDESSLGLMSPGLPGVAADGSFTFTNVTPGRYRLLARAGAGAPVVIGGAITSGPEIPPRFGMVDFSVGDADVSGLVIALRPLPPLSGRVIFDAAATEPPQNLELVRLTLVPTRSGSRPVMDPGIVSVAANARSDGTIRFPAVMPGAFTMTSPLAGWWLRSAVIKGRDILDLPLEVDGSSLELPEVVVTFTDRRTELGGTLSTTSGQPPSEFVVVAFPSEREYWRRGARRIKSVRPASDGAFSFADLPPGDYLIGAVTDADPDEWQQASFLEQLVPASVKVTIGEGQKVRQDLRIAR